MHGFGKTAKNHCHAKTICWSSFEHEYWAAQPPPQNRIGLHQVYSVFEKPSVSERFGCAADVTVSGYIVQHV